MKKSQVAVIGLGAFGIELVKSLSSKGASVIAIDRNENFVNDVNPYVDAAYIGDATDEEFLKQCGINDCDVCVVTVGEDIEASTFIVILLKDLGVKNIYAKASSKLHARILSSVGATKIIYPELDAAERVSDTIINPGLDVLGKIGQEEIFKIKAPEGFISKSIRELDIRNVYGITILAVYRKKPVAGEDGSITYEEEVIANPVPDFVIEEADEILVFGRHEILRDIK